MQDLAQVDPGEPLPLPARWEGTLLQPALRNLPFPPASVACALQPPGGVPDGAAAPRKKRAVARRFKRIRACVLENKRFGDAGEEQSDALYNKILRSGRVHRAGHRSCFWKELRCE